MKSNDNIPEDEMLLAEAIAAAKARGLGWTEGAYFRDRGGEWTDTPDNAVCCCASAALFLAGRDPLPGVAIGNDWTRWTTDHHLTGESLGWAFRLAMTQDEP